MKIKVAQFGLGPIGLECLKSAALQSWAKIVGAIDVDPGKIGKDLGEMTKLETLRNLKVAGSLEEIEAKPDLIFHTAVSRFKLAYEQLEPIAWQGINVVSSCEEMVFPQLKEPRLAVKLDRICRQSGSRIIGTGVNPGFVMDLLPLCLSGVCQKVRTIHIERVVNASTRREPLQRKIGSGLPPEQFRQLLKTGAAGHAGLRESLALLANKLSWQTSEILETGDPIVAEHDIRTQYLEVRKDQTCGLHQRAEARSEGELRITLDLKMYLGAENPHDRIQIEGEPPIDMLIRGGIAGDQATVAALVNIAPRLLRGEPGLRLVTDLPLA